jgi:uncharacterized protein (TIGR03118 family)
MLTKEKIMKSNMSTKIVIALVHRCRPGLLGLAAALALVPIPAPAKDGDHKSNTYLQTNLVSNLAGIAQLQDTNLVNPWGISFSSISPFWISDNGSGLSTLYAVTNDLEGSPHVVKQGLEVVIPGGGVPTGQLFDGNGGFHGDIFIFAGEDGTISGWHSALGNTAELLTSRDTAVYKGITLVSGHDGPWLVLANFSEATVDVYDTNFDLVQFSDPTVPDGYAPFNVKSLGRLVIVTFAKQDPEKHDDVPGPGHGLIDIFNPKTGQFHRFATGSDAGGHLDALSSPWGIAVAPGKFGVHGDELLVGNFGSGTIMTFDADGEFGGFLEDPNHQPIAIDGLWGLAFGNGGKAGVPDVLYFTAGLNNEADGLFGSLVPEPRKMHKDKD